MLSEADRHILAEIADEFNAKPPPERCKLVDLGRWLREEYRIPAEEDESEGPSDGPSGGDRRDA